MDKPRCFDLHCDTLTRSLYRPAAPGHGPLNEPSAQLSLDRMPAGKRWVQCYAVFVPDDKRGAEGAAFFDHWAAVFAREMEREAHRVGREKAYCHIEKLTNLDQLPVTGFKVNCFPVSIKAASAGWARVVAFVE